MKQDPVTTKIDRPFHELMQRVADYESKPLGHLMRAWAAQGLDDFSNRRPDVWARLNHEQLNLNHMTVVKKPGRPKKDV